MIANFITNKKGSVTLVDKTDESLDEEVFCDVCGMTYKEFLETGIFGCENCYKVFKARTVALIKDKIQNSRDEVKKTNKIETPKAVAPSKQKIKKRIAELEKLLELCKQYNEKDKITIIEEELKELKKIEIEK